MTKELTSEQVVTNLLISNGFIKSAESHKINMSETGLGAYLSKQNNTETLTEKSRYAFINTESGWNF